MGIGVMESLVFVPFAIVSIALPIVTFVLVLLMYRKISRIEEKLGR